MNDDFGDGPIKRSRVFRLSFVVNAGFSDHLEAAETNAIALSASMLLLSMLQMRVHHVRKPNAAVWLAVAINLDADAIRVDLAGRKVEAATASSVCLASWRSTGPSNTDVSSTRRPNRQGPGSGQFLTSSSAGASPSREDAARTRLHRPSIRLPVSPRAPRVGDHRSDADGVPAYTCVCPLASVTLRIFHGAGTSNAWRSNRNV